MFWILTVVVCCLLNLCLGADMNESELIFDKLRRDWRREELKRKSLGSEIELIYDQIRIETQLYDNMMKLKGVMEAFGNEKPKFIKDDENVERAEKKWFVYLVKLADEAKKRYLEKKKELLRTEMLMERLWTDWKFRIAFDYLLDKSVLTPQPKFPEIDRTFLDKAVKVKEHLLKESLNRAGLLEKYLRGLNEQILGIGRVLGSLDFLGELKEQIYKLKRHVEGMTSENTSSNSNSNLTPASSTAILRTINNYEKNQRDEMEIYVQQGTGRMIRKFKQLIDNLVYDPNGKWTMRLGHGAFKLNPKKEGENTNLNNSNINNVSTINNNNASAIINNNASINILPQHIIRRSEQSELNLNLLRTSKSTLRTYEQTRHLKYKEFYLTNGNEFLIAKYSQFLGEIHRYLVRQGEAVPVTVYEEALGTLFGTVEQQNQALSVA